jgi:hypothetical protein
MSEQKSAELLVYPMDLQLWALLADRLTVPQSVLARADEIIQ